MWRAEQARGTRQRHPPPELHEDLETVQRMSSIRRRESVCRSLFGPVDHDQLRRDLKQKLREMSEQDSRRWNFNFRTDTPLPGRFEWEEMPADRAAAAYRESGDTEEAACSPDAGGDDDRLGDRGGSAGADQENCSRISNTHKCPAEVTPVRRKRTLSRAAAKPRDNARITDFFTKRRRTAEAKSVHSHFCTSEAAQCKTIR